jgi:acetyl-CoA C-acetyltransferase
MISRLPDQVIYQSQRENLMSTTSLTDAFIYDGGRSAFGRHGGALAPVRPDDLLAHVIKTVVERNAFSSQCYEDVIMGNTNGAGEDCRNVARFSLLRAGMPVEVAGLTVNRLCGSSSL